MPEAGRPSRRLEGGRAHRGERQAREREAPTGDDPEVHARPDRTANGFVRFHWNFLSNFAK